MIKLAHRKFYVVTGPWGKTVAQWWDSPSRQGWYLPGNEELFSVEQVPHVHRMVRL